MTIVTKRHRSPERPTRRWLLAALGLGAVLLAPPQIVLAQEHGSGGESGHGGGAEAGGEHGGGGGSQGGSESGHGGGGGSQGGGESGHGAGAGQTPAQRAIRHRERFGRTQGGGESGGGPTGGGHTGGSHTGGGEEATGATPGSTGTLISLPDGSTTGPIGGSVGGEHFVHAGPGNWGADAKVLRLP